MRHEGSENIRVKRWTQLRGQWRDSEWDKETEGEEEEDRCTGEAVEEEQIKASKYLFFLLVWLLRPV